MLLIIHKNTFFAETYFMAHFMNLFFRIDKCYFVDAQYVVDMHQYLILKNFDLIRFAFPAEVAN